MEKTKITKTKASKGPITMAELLAGSQNKVRSLSTGQKIQAKVIAKTPKSLVLDIGGKSEGVVAERAFVEARDFIKTLEAGDSVLATVLIPETREGFVLLSLRSAAFEASWEKLEKAKEEGKPVAVFGRGVNPSGVTVDMDGLNGFVPTSQLGKEAAKNSQALVGRHFKVKVLEVDRLANKVVLSEKEVSDAEDIKAVKAALSKVQDGAIFDGVVTTVANFGCFVKIELPTEDHASVEGLVHISELSWSKVGATSDVVREGDKVKVKVIGQKDGRLALSIKQAEADPWEKAGEKYKAEETVKGKVGRTSDFGVFVELEPGIDGLIHITNIPPGRKLTEGEVVECYVQEIDAKAKKLSLGLVLTSKPIGYK